MNAFGLKDEVLAFIVDAAKDCDMSEVILFGSRAKGTFSEKSDIDLAVSGNRYHDFIETVDEECPTLLEFDFIDMSRGISEELRHRIEKEGVVLYEVC